MLLPLNTSEGTSKTKPFSCISILTCLTILFGNLTMVQYLNLKSIFKFCQMFQNIFFTSFQIKSSFMHFTQFYGILVSFNLENFISFFFLFLSFLPLMFLKSIGPLFCRLSLIRVLCQEQSLSNVAILGQIRRHMINNCLITENGWF